MKALLLVVLTLAALLFGPPVKTAQASIVSDVIGKIPDATLSAPLKKMLSQFKEITPGSKTYSATGTLFNQTATVYIYSQGNMPVMAAVLPGVLTADKLFHIGSALDVGLKNPLLFWTTDGGTLNTNDMPPGLKSSVEKSGMPGTVQAASGFNLFGKLADGSIGALLNKAPVNLPKDLFAAVSAAGKGSYTASLSIASGTRWNNPFGIVDTVITGGTVHISVTDSKKSVEAWGTARIKNRKDFTIYVKGDGTGTVQSLGLDIDKVSLEDYFLVLSVVSNSLRLPTLPAPKNLPLTMVLLENPVYKRHIDASSPPAFDTMMFMGTLETGAIGELITHAKGSIFKKPVALINLTASSAGVNGDADLKVALGPLEAASATFYLNVSPNSTPRMGITAKTIFDKLTLVADKDGLKLNVPAQCPLRPVGLTATLGDLTVSDFPIKPDLKDCFSAEIGKLADDVSADAKDTWSFCEGVTKDAAANAVTLGNESVTAVKSLHLERAATWGEALVVHAADVKAAKDAVSAANSAVASASKSVKKLEGEISSLDGEIKHLGNKIHDLLKSAWGFVTGHVKSLKSDKSKAESKRDHKRTAKAAAKHRLAHANTVKANANGALKELPGPTVADGPMATLQEELLGAQAQAEVQPRVAEYATRLAASLNSPDQRKKILAAGDSKAFIAARETDFSAAYPTLKAALTAKDGKMPMPTFLADSKKVLVTEAVSKLIEDETEQILKETVPGLPTMAFDMPVSIANGEGSNALCLERILKKGAKDGSAEYHLSPCNDSEYQTFLFRAGGTVTTGFAGSPTRSCITISDTTHPTLESSDCGKAQLFFFDPMDGLIRYLPTNAMTPQCLQANANSVTSNNCPAPEQQMAGGLWRLRATGPDKVKTTAAKTFKATSGKSETKSLTGHKRTNLMPLEL